jgi:enterochelin esterase-like enzyme
MRSILKRFKITAVLTAAIFISGLTACGPVLLDENSAEHTQVVTATQTETQIPPTPTFTPTATSTTVPTPSSTIEPCLLVKGQLLEKGIYVGGMSEPMTFNIYLPPCYDEQTAREFPILYMLHGKDYGKDQWDRLGLISTANEMIAAGQIPPIIIVLPEDLVAEYPDEDFFEDDLINDVIPYIEENFRVKEGAENRALGGLSRGAGWTFYIGLNNPEMFSALGMHSLAIFNSLEEGEYQSWLDMIEPEDMPRIYIDHGEEEFDLLKNSISEFIDHLEAGGFEYEFNVFPGAHDELYWSHYLYLYLLFYSENWD